MAEKHKSKTHLSSKLVNAVYILLSFILSILMILCSLSVILSLTVFSKGNMLNAMNSTGYYNSIRSEITVLLTDLGYASGLNESFFEDLIDNDMLEQDVSGYLDSFYSGTGSVINTDSFKQHFSVALDEYIKDNNIDPESVDPDSRKNLIINAAKIYKASLELPFFSNIAGYFIGIKNILPVVIAVLGVLVALLCVILIFSTKWKHRPVKYICYSTITVFWVTLLPVVLAYATRKFEQLNIGSRAMYNVFVAFGYNTVNGFMYCSIMFAIISLVLYVLYRKLYPKSVGAF